MPRDRSIVFAAVLALFAVVSFVAERVSEPHAGKLTPIARRKPMSNLTATDINGNPWQLDAHRGQILLINFWATWCGPCREETPGLVKLTQDPTLKDVAILGISLDAGGNTPPNRAKVEAFMHRFHIPYPIAFPPQGSQLEFGLDLIPTTILVDPNGRIAKLYEGAVRQSVFAADIHQLQHEQ